MALFVFTRDLRLDDNTTLLQLVQEQAIQPIYLAFIFNEEQVGGNNPYRSVRAVNFMIESLDSLSKRVHINYFLVKDLGELPNCLNQIHQDNPLKRLAYNFDVTVFARRRDEIFRQWAESHGIEVLNSS